MTTPFPSVPDLEFLRKRAKDLLRGAQRGDVEALRAIRATLPRRADATDVELAAQLRLADAQQAVAREHGFESWARLRRAVEERQPPAVRAERLLAAVRAGDADAALVSVREPDELAALDVRCAAALGDDEALAAALASDPASATEADQNGWAPLLYACASRAGGDEVGRCVELLLAHGADPNSFTLFDPRNPETRLPALYWACAAGHAQAARLLLERGAEPNDGESIYHAAERYQVECLELLLAHGAEISATDATWGNTPLQFVAGYDGEAPLHGLRWLLEHGADPNVRSGRAKETALHTVAERNNIAAVELLLEHGADPNRARRDGRTPYVLAMRSGNNTVADLLREAGADTSSMKPVDAFLSACLSGDEATARRLLADHPRLLDELSSVERRAVSWAVQHDREESVRLMAELGFPLRLEGPDGGTPLHWAAWHGRTQMVRLLLELEAPLNVRDKRFRSTPLGWAAHGSANCRAADDEYAEVVEALLDAGATIDEPPETVATPRIAALIRSRR